MQIQPSQAKQPRNPFMFHSAFKLSVYFKNNRSVCKSMHSVETKSTIPQIRNGKIQTITFDRRAGYHYCLDLITSMADKVHTAILWDAYEENIIFAQFKAGKWLHTIEPNFEENFLQVSKQFTIYNGFVICSDVALNAAAKNINSPIKHKL